MFKTTGTKKYIKVYHGYGHKHDLIIYGHLFAGEPVIRKKYSTRFFPNLWYLLRLFFVNPLPGQPVVLHWKNEALRQTTEADGFIKFEWESADDTPAGWHDVEIQHNENGYAVTGRGSLFVPHITQYGFISDIDDTIMVSHSATIIKRLKALFTTNPRTREIFDGVAEHYGLLSASHTTPEAPNPFFYVSSSEWNLYDYLHDFFSFHRLPEGAFLLNQVKRWYQLFATGKTKHSGKLIRIVRILDTFPNQQFILLGDNTQHDPLIYKQIAEKYTGRILAIYIRNVYQQKEAATRTLLEELERNTGVLTCLFDHSADAIAHSRKIGLIG